MHIQQIITQRGEQSHNFHEPCTDIFLTELEVRVVTAYEVFLKVGDIEPKCRYSNGTISQIEKIKQI